jgi:hypothetical protein
MGIIARGEEATVNLAFAVQQGIKNADCDRKAGTVTAAIFSGGGKRGVTGVASKITPLPVRTIGWLGTVSPLAGDGSGTIPVTVRVPVEGLVGLFGFTVVLTLLDDN